MDERETSPEQGDTFEGQPKESAVNGRAGFAQKNDGKIKKLEGLAGARQRQPENPRLKAAEYEAVKQVLEEDPFLAYQAETDTAYQVLDHAQEVLVVPKERTVPEPFPIQRPEPIRNAYRFLVWALLGLLLSGLGALIFAPVAGLYAARALGQTGPKDRVRARVVITLAVLLFGLGLALAYLFWLHVQG